MKQKKIVLIVVFVFALLLAGAYPLYNSLSQEDAADQLVVLPQGNKPSIKPAETKPSEPAETKPSEPAETEPGKPAETKPSKPAETEPSKPAETEPSKPAETEPSKPAETEPTEPEATDPPVELAYDFTVYDGNGKAMKLSDYVGKPIVLNFWASWCGPCKSEMPEFQAVYEEMGDEVQFLMVNATVSDTMADAKAFIKQYGYTFPVLFDTSGEALHVYGVDAFPTTYFLDKEGNPAAYAVGAISKANLLKGINMIK